MESYYFLAFTGQQIDGPSLFSLLNVNESSGGASSHRSDINIEAMTDCQKEQTFLQIT